MNETDIQNTRIPNTKSDEAEKSQEEITTSETESVPQDGERVGVTFAQDDDGEDFRGNDSFNKVNDEKPFLEIQYNHQKHGLTREEAKMLAQKGIYYQKAYDTLERVSALKGKTVEEFLNMIEEAQDELYRQNLVEKFGDDEETIEKMMELYEINKQKKLDEAKDRHFKSEKEEEQNENQRLAEEFFKMKNGDFPELTDFSMLPDEVKRKAFEGKSLEHAYLSFLHNENKKISAAKEKQKTAALAATGSLKSGKEENSSSFERGFLKGLLG